MQLIGRQILAEMTHCAADRLDDLARLEELMVEAARAAGATVLGVKMHRFEPHGVSGVVVIAESHLTIHTWPELGYAAVDAFTCGDMVSPQRAVEVLSQGLGACQVTTLAINRGINLADPPPPPAPEAHPQPAGGPA